MRGPGFEPGPSAWKAEVLTTRPPTLDLGVSLPWYCEFPFAGSSYNSIRSTIRSPSVDMLTPTIRI